MTNNAHAYSSFGKSVRKAAVALLIPFAMFAGTKDAKANEPVRPTREVAIVRQVEAPSELVNRILRTYEVNKELKAGDNPEKYSKLYMANAFQLLKEKDKTTINPEYKTILSEILNRCGIIKRNKEKWEDSYNLLVGSIQLNRNNHYAWNNLGNYYMKFKKEYSNALKCFETALMIKPNFYGSKQGKRRCLKYLNRCNDCLIKVV